MFEDRSVCFLDDTSEKCGATTSRQGDSRPFCPRDARLLAHDTFCCLSLSSFPFLFVVPRSHLSPSRGLLIGLVRLDALLETPRDPKSALVLGDERGPTSSICTLSAPQGGAGGDRRGENVPSISEVSAARQRLIPPATHNAALRARAGDVINDSTSPIAFI